MIKGVSAGAYNVVLNRQHDGSLGVTFKAVQAEGDLYYVVDDISDLQVWFVFKCICLVDYYTSGTRTGHSP